ncbi:F0F1 ATP synthase subunit B [Lactobacillaceae bacterium L1_55_11]|nr:F0F1 ATP synthase subunit B [Lactobacillaceae bacterium L1_55_11]
MLGTTLLAATQLELGDMLFVIVAFLLLMVILWRVAYKPLMKVLDQRADKISGDLDGAETARKEAEDLSQQRQAELTKTRQESSQVIQQAKASAQKQGQDLLDAANERATAIDKQAESDAGKLKADALAQAKDDVADLSVAIAAKLMKKELSADDQRSLINAYIAELDQK